MTTLDTRPVEASSQMRRIAHLVPLLTLPSGLWRIALVVGLPVAAVDPGGFWVRAYIVTLTVVSEGAALTTLGLVQPWGEVAPRWIPWIGGRPVRPLAAFIPAIAGATILTALWIWVFWGMAGSDFYDYFNGPQSVIVTACYLPLLLWGPLLAVVAVRVPAPPTLLMPPRLRGDQALPCARAPSRSRLSCAIVSSGMPLGHADVHSPMLVQPPKPS